MKPQIKVTAINDGKFNKYKDEETILIATTTRGPLYIEKVNKTKVKVDGSDSTEKIIQLVNSKSHIEQSKAILIHGTTVAGLNIVDVKRVNEETGKPVITVLKKKPNEEEIKKAIDKTGEKEKKKTIEKNPPHKEHEDIYYSKVGIKEKEAEEMLGKLRYRGKYPEPLRISHLIASGVSGND